MKLHKRFLTKVCENKIARIVINKTYNTYRIGKYFKDLIKTYSSLVRPHILVEQATTVMIAQ